MTTPEQQPELPHEEGLSLAWYAAGKLTESEQSRVARHLETCAQCRAELQSVTHLRHEIRQAFESEPGPSPKARQALMTRLHAAQPNKSAAGFFARWVDWLRVPAVPRWAPIAALLLVVVPAGLLLRNPAEVTTRGLATTPTRLSAQFNPQATDAQIRGLLSTLGARIVDGPGPSGEYLIELAAMDPAILGQKITAARAHPEVLQSLELAPP